MPALLTSTSTPPYCATAASNRRRTAAGSDTSAWTAMAWPPASQIVLTTLAASSALPA